MSVLSSFFGKPNYQTYAISVLNGLANAEPEKGAHPVCLRFEINIAKDGQDNKAWIAANMLRKGVDKILKKVLNQPPASNLDKHRDPDYYHVEFFVRHPRGMDIQEYQELLRKKAEDLTRSQFSKKSSARNYQTYAIGVLKGLANAKPEEGAHPVCLRFETSFARGVGDEGKEAYAFREGVDKILKEVLNQTTQSELDERRDPNNYHVAFLVSPTGGMDIKKYKEWLWEKAEDLTQSQRKGKTR